MVSSVVITATDVVVAAAVVVIVCGVVWLLGHRHR